MTRRGRRSDEESGQGTSEHCSWKRKKFMTRKPQKVLRLSRDSCRRLTCIDAKKTETEKAEEAESEILAAISSRRKLASDLELAKGVQYTEPIKTTYANDPIVSQYIAYSFPRWTPPRFVRNRSADEHRRLREKYHIIVEGDDIPPPIENFTVWNSSLTEFSSLISAPGYESPRTSRQIPQVEAYHKTHTDSTTGYTYRVCRSCLYLFTFATDPSISFAGRDMIGIAFTGSGKTLAFCLPIIMFALEEESKLPFIRGEGPVGVILCPSRELATQTYENVLTWTAALSKDGKYPQINTLLCIGGISMGDQSHVLGKGLHIVVATPGRLIDMLEKKRFTFDNCRYLCMDEADRMIDLGFEDDVRNIMSFFKVRFISTSRN